MPKLDKEEKERSNPLMPASGRASATKKAR